MKLNTTTWEEVPLHQPLLRLYRTYSDSSGNDETAYNLYVVTYFDKRALIADGHEDFDFSEGADPALRTTTEDGKLKITLKIAETAIPGGDRSFSEEQGHLHSVVHHINLGSVLWPEEVDHKAIVVEYSSNLETNPPTNTGAIAQIEADDEDLGGGGALEAPSEPPVIP